MRIITAVALVAAIAGCEQQSTRLDSVTKKDNVKDTPAERAAPPAATVSAKADHSGSVEERLARLEDNQARNAEALDFLAKIYASRKAQEEQQAREEPAPDAMFAVDVSEDIKAGQVDGPATAPVTIIKAFDFACPYCQQAAPALEELVKDYNGKVRVVYANMIIHPQARPAHFASCAAAKQGKYMAFKDAFWDKGFGPYAASQGKDSSSLGEDNIVAIAKGLGLDVEKFKTDMKSSECSDRVKHDVAELQKFHVNATPTFFINGKRAEVRSLSADAFKPIIDEELKVAEASGVPGGEYWDKVVMTKGEKQFRSKMDAKPN